MLWPCERLASSRSLAPTEGTELLRNSLGQDKGLWPGTHCVMLSLHIDMMDGSADQRCADCRLKSAVIENLRRTAYSHWPEKLWNFVSG